MPCGKKVGGDGPGTVYSVLLFVLTVVGMGDAKVVMLTDGLDKEDRLLLRRIERDDEQP
jgi:hypothetical protein